MNQKLEKALENLQVAEKQINSSTSVEFAPTTNVEPKQPSVEPIPPKKAPVVPVGNVTPKVLAEAKKAELPQLNTIELSENQLKLRKFVDLTDAIYGQNVGTPYEKWYATNQAWSYLAALNHTHVNIKELWEDKDPFDANAVVVYARAELVDDEVDGEPLCSTVMCASSNESWLKGKPLSAVYGLAQTRAEERVVKTVFGYQLSLARLQPVGAEELDVDVAKYGNKDKEI